MYRVTFQGSFAIRLTKLGQGPTQPGPAFVGPFRTLILTERITSDFSLQLRTRLINKVTTTAHRRDRHISSPQAAHPNRRHSAAIAHLLTSISARTGLRKSEACSTSPRKALAPSVTCSRSRCLGAVNVIVHTSTVVRTSGA